MERDSNLSSGKRINVDYDLIVVGAGPAGASAAREASKSGASVLLLDGVEFPRSKPCGGAVSEQALSYLDFPLDKQLIQGQVYGARVFFDGTVVEARRDSRIAVLTQRKDFDSFLVEKAKESGVDVLFGERVDHLWQCPDYVFISTKSQTFRACYVIGADGAQSVVAREVRPRLSKHEFAVSYEADILCQATSPSLLANDLIHIHFGKDFMGYRWVFPKKLNWNIGVGAVASQSSNVKAATSEFFKSLVELPFEDGSRLENGKGWILPIGGYKREVGLNRILLVGDAAGFVDPFYGEGIAYAILSGKQAGAIIGKACVAPTEFPMEGVRAEYEQFCKSYIFSDFRYGLAFAKILHRWPKGLLKIFSTNPKLLSGYLKVPAGEVSYKEYFYWFFPRAVICLLKSFALDIKKFLVGQPNAHDLRE
jgi:geranylgeranyl reductase family protein